MVTRSMSVQTAFIDPTERSFFINMVFLYLKRLTGTGCVASESVCVYLGWRGVRGI